jgi:tetratricopeptide (TPR) repeat protein
LVDAYPEEKQLWVQDYYEEKSQILNLYNTVTKEIFNEINVILTPEEERLLAKSRTVDREAYDAYLRSYQYWDDLSQESLNKALDYLNLAIEKDPGFAPSYAGLATVWAGLAQLGFEVPEVAGPKIYENLNKAIELDPDFPSSHYIKAVIGVWTEWDWEKGEREFLKALELNPNDAMSRVHYAHLLWILKRYDEALFHAQMAAELDPLNPLVLALSAMLDEHGRIPQALKKCKKALEIDPEHHFALLAYAEATYFNGDYKSSIETELKTWPGLDDEAREDIMAVFQDKGYVEAIRKILTYMEEYAKTNNISYFEMGEYYWKVGNLEKSIECFIKAYELHDPMMPYITLSEIGFDDIKDDPRIISIVEKMNLPID